MLKRRFCSLLISLFSFNSIAVNTASATSIPFDNVYPFPPKTFWQAMKWRWTRSPVAWPESRSLNAQPKVGQELAPGQISVTWVGHSTFLLEFENYRVLTDPVYSKTLGPVAWLAPTRVTEPGLTLEKTPKIDLILLSHDHFDHMDLPTLEFFARRDNPAVVAGLGNKPLLQETGFEKVIELDWWGNHTVDAEAQVTFVPAQHWSTRSLFSRNTTLWGGFYFVVKGKTFYFVGDTGYHPKLFKDIRARVGSPDFSFVPIGAYAPRDFMRDQHVNPEEAVDLHLDVQSKQSVGMHWGTFQLTDEGIDEPCQELKTASEARNLGRLDFTCMNIGETRFLGPDELQAGQ